MPSIVEDQRAGRLLTLLRKRAGLTQATLAERASVPRRDIQRIEAGMAGLVFLDRVRRAFEAVGGRGRFGVWWNGAAADRLLDERHAALVERAVALFEERGWKTAAEVSFSEYGERGSIDILASHQHLRAVAVVEVKSELGSIEETNRVLDAKERLGPKVAERRFGWRPAVIGRILVVADESTPRRVVARHRRTMRAVYPAGGREVRAWLRGPRTSLRGIWFLSLAPGRNTDPAERPHQAPGAP